MAGWRVGALLGGSTYLDAVLRFKSNMDSGMFKPIQLAAAKALQLPPSWYEKQNEIYRSRRQLAEQILASLQCSFDPRQTGLFLWAKVPDSYKDAYELSDWLLAEYRVFITPGGVFGTAAKQYIRLSLCKPEAVFNVVSHRIEDKNEAYAISSFHEQTVKQ